MFAQRGAGALAAMTVSAFAPTGPGTGRRGEYPATATTATANAAAAPDAFLPPARRARCRGHAARAAIGPPGARNFGNASTATPLTGFHGQAGHHCLPDRLTMSMFPWASLRIGAESS